MSAKTIPYQCVAVTKSDTNYITDQQRTPVNETAVKMTTFDTDVITKVAHGYANSDVLKCTNVGTSSLVADASYYVIYIDADTFSVTTTFGGAAASMGATTTTAPTFKRLSTLNEAVKVTGSLFVGVAGDVVVLPEAHLDTDDATVCVGGAQKFTVPSGFTIVGHFKKVFDTGTTATNINCQYE